MRSKLYRVYDFIRSVLVLLGLNLRLKTADRKILENTLLPYLESIQQNSSILNVGANWYTKNYSAFFSKNYYVEIELDWWRFQFCSSPVKIRGNLLDLPGNFTFDYIILNGVFGYGIDRKEDKKQAIVKIKKCLKKNGTVILGGTKATDLSLPIQILQTEGFIDITPDFLKEDKNRTEVHQFVFLSKPEC